MYKCINGWTKRKMINKVNKEFKGKSFEERWNSPGQINCLYRGPKGKKCAFGLFIPDKLFSQSFNNLGAYEFFNEVPAINTYTPLSINGIANFQKCHDSLDIRKHKTVKSQKEVLINWIKANVVD